MKVRLEQIPLRLVLVSEGPDDDRTIESIKAEKVHSGITAQQGKPTEMEIPLNRPTAGSTLGTRIS